MSIRLTKFETTKIIGTRAEQIARGATPNVDTTGLMDPIEIAKLELKEHKIPMVLERPLPDGTIFKIKLTDRNVVIV